MNLSNSGGRTALHAAVENKSKHVVEYLIDVCAVSPFVRWRLVDIRSEKFVIPILFFCLFFKLLSFSCFW